MKLIGSRGLLNHNGILEIACADNDYYTYVGKCLYRDIDYGFFNSIEQNKEEVRIEAMSNSNNKLLNEQY